MSLANITPAHRFLILMEKDDSYDWEISGHPDMASVTAALQELIDSQHAERQIAVVKVCSLGKVAERKGYELDMRDIP